MKKIIAGEIIVDIIVKATIILEFKVFKKNFKSFEIQSVNYLVATRKPVGLKFNFGENKIEIKRKVKEIL